MIFESKPNPPRKEIFSLCFDPSKPESLELMASCLSSKSLTPAYLAQHIEKGTKA